MRSQTSKGQKAFTRDRIETLGLSPDELSLLRTAAGGEWEVEVTASPLAALTDSPGNGRVLVISLSGIEALYVEPAVVGALSTARFVLLLPADASEERQCWSTRIASRAHLVITSLSDSAQALHAALRTLHHNAVADALVERLDSLNDDLAKRALIAAVRLDPSVRNVPSLSQALYMTERTCRRQLNTISHAIAPHHMLNWACLLHTVWHLRATKRSFERIAYVVGASAPSNLQRLLRLYTGYAAGNLRSTRSDPIEIVLSAWRTAVAGTAQSVPNQQRRTR